MSHPIMISVVSSNVSKIGYDNEKQEVFVRFNNGSLYIYKNVPKTKFDGLRNASSVGSYLHKNFINVYPYTRVE